MKSLLYKDLYLIKGKILIGMAIILAVSMIGVIVVLGMTKGNFRSFAEEAVLFDLFMQGFILLVIGTGIYTALNSASAIEMDEKSEWYKVLYASPISVRAEIASRYVLAFLVNTIMTLWATCMMIAIYAAAGKSYGAEEMKLTGYCFIFGICMILIRLPIDITFPAKMSSAISVGIIVTLLCALIIWMAITGISTVFDSLEKATKLVKKYAVLIIALISAVSITVSYYGKKNRRWA